MDITVAIPTYNGAFRLPEVLGSLQKQLETQEITWEILVIDNNSTDHLADVIAQCQRFLPRLRLCHESKAGAGFARQRAFEEARGKLVAFLDDDTIPDLLWVYAIAQFANTHPHAGAYGSRVHADYAVPPPPGFDRIASFLAITEMGSEPVRYSKSNRLLPPSAGLAVRKSVWEQYVPKKMVLSGRTEGNMLTGEDLEMLSYIQLSPWEIWYNPNMEITHKIPATRLDKKYLIPFMRGIGLSRYITRMIGRKGTKKLILTLAYLGNDLRRILFHLFKYRTRVRTDIVAASELSFLIGSLVSPFFLWQNGFFEKTRCFAGLRKA